MNRFSAVVLTAFVAVFAVSCGGGKSGTVVKEGDKLEVMENLERERFEASYGPSVREITHTNGANMEIPKGVILEVFATPRQGADKIEVVPVKYVSESGEIITDAETLRDRFVQERYRMKDGAPDPDFLYYSFIIDINYLGTKVKKVE